MVALLTEFVPRTCRSGSLDSSSLATMCRKLSTKGLMLWEWHAISSWSSASMAITTYLQPVTGKMAPLDPDSRFWSGSVWTGSSPVAMPHHVPAQPVGKVRPDPVQLLRRRHGVEGQLLHVRLTEAILTGSRAEKTGRVGPDLKTFLPDRMTRAELPVHLFADDAQIYRLTFPWFP